MEISYRISLWNYFHYHEPGTLETVIAQIREAGYGVEIWPRWFGENDIFEPVNRRRLKGLLSDIPSSIHGGRPDTIDNHRKQIETAAVTGSDVIVVHPDQVRLNVDPPDYDFCQEVVSMAREKDVVIALENGPLAILENALRNVEDLGICLDVGHVYFTPDPMASFVDSLKEDICHLHLQDTLGEIDHYVPGTGIIPESDWMYLFEALEEVGFEGAGVLEIRPRNPIQHAEMAGEFFAGLLSSIH